MLEWSRFGSFFCFRQLRLAEKAIRSCLLITNWQSKNVFLVVKLNESCTFCCWLLFVAAMKRTDLFWVGRHLLNVLLRWQLLHLYLHYYTSKAKRRFKMVSVVTRVIFWHVVELPGRPNQVAFRQIGWKKHKAMPNLWPWTELEYCKEN